MIEQLYSGQLFFRRISVPNPCGSLVFIHGLGESGLCFEQTMASISNDPLLSGWNQLAPDLPGYGKSLPPSIPLNLSELAALIPDWCSPFIQSPVIILGHSMGGVIGQLMAEESDGMIAGFINVEGNLSTGDCVFSGKAAAYSPDEFEMTGFDLLKDSVYRNGLKFFAQRGYYASMRFAWASQFHLNSQNLLDFSATADAADRFAKLHLPKLYITGQPSGICAESMAALTATASPVAVIRDAGHWPFIDQPIDFLNHVTRFFRSL
ncbi:alpha/beta hydrolase [bacterium]|nr:alpha/beta hydrolase [candidate division CSSED10-310 bacterium]